MKNSMGYYGPISMDPNPLPDPRAALVPHQIIITVSEVIQATRALGMPGLQGYYSSNPSQRKMIVAQILRARGDKISMAQADQVLQTNPAFSDVQVIQG